MASKKPANEGAFLLNTHELPRRAGEMREYEIDIDAPSGATTESNVLALNEAVLEKTGAGHTIRLDVALDGSFFTPYAADGLIVATATGSTACSSPVPRTSPSSSPSPTATKRGPAQGPM